MVQTEDRLHVLQEAADELLVSTQTLKRWERRGLVRLVRVVPGGRWRITEAELQRLRRGIDDE